MDFPVSFCPLTYRKLYPDLQLMSDDTLRDHYLTYGVVEGRQACEIRDRSDFLKLFEKIRPALEIGAFDSPLLHQTDVRHFDVIDQDGLKARARDMGRNVESVPFIDYVSQECDLSIIQERFELVVSSHAIEHTPDLVKHLKDISKLLSNSGVYALMIPDCRYCFEHFIPPSSIADVLQAHQESRKVHTLASVIEHRALTTHNEPSKHWVGDHGNKIGAEPSRVLAAISEWKNSQGRYIDVHAWQFTPETFENLVLLLWNANYIDLKPVRIYNPVHGSNEFLAILARGI